MENLDKGLMQILELSRDIIYMVEVYPKLKMVFINGAVTDKLGISVEENYKNPNRALESAHVDDREKFKIKVTGELDYSNPIEMRYQHINGHYIWFEESVIPIYDDQKQLIALIGFCRDIQERKIREEELRSLTFEDSLTGIKNRTFFEKTIGELNATTNAPIGMIICDLDDLKHINDTLGHIAGDRVLRRFAKILDQYTSDRISVARIGGDEFALLIKGAKNGCVEALFLTIQKAIKAYNVDNKDLPISVSMGTGYCETSLGMVYSIYNTADSRMYQNKAANKKRMRTKPPVAMLK